MSAEQKIDPERERFNNRLYNHATPKQRSKIKHYRNMIMSADFTHSHRDARRVVQGRNTVYIHRHDQYVLLNQKFDNMGVPG